MTPQPAHRIAVFAAVLFVSGAAHTAPAAAEDPSAGQIVDALQPKVSSALSILPRPSASQGRRTS